MSTFKYNVYDNEQIDQMKYSLLQEGEYSFEVISAVADVSKSSGNPMLVIELRVFGGEAGADKVIKDYIVDVAAMAHKLRDFLFSLGLSDLYDTGEFDVNLLSNKRGKAIIAVEKGKIKPDGTKYWDRNVVKEYLLQSIHKFAKPNDEKSLKEDIKEFDDDIPF